MTSAFPDEPDPSPAAAATPDLPTPDLPMRADEHSEHVPLAMQIALRIEKTNPPTDLDACAAAAAACVELLVEAQARAAAGDGTWLADVDAWRGVAIRKIVRRCSGKRWVDAQALDGVTVDIGGAQARAFVPAPISPLPPELKKMQVEGTNLPAASEPMPDAFVTVCINPHLEMTAGKSAAQCAHAAQRAWEAMNPSDRQAWADTDHRVAVVRETAEGWARSLGRVSITDAGFTELDGQHETTRADW